MPPEQSGPAKKGDNPVALLLGKHIPAHFHPLVRNWGSEMDMVKLVNNHTDAEEVYRDILNKWIDIR